MIKNNDMNKLKTKGFSVKGEKVIRFNKTTSYQNIRVLNRKIKFEGGLGKEIAHFKNSLIENRIYKKQLVSLKKQLKKFKKSAKEGVKNKGWITRTQKEMKHMQELAQSSYNDLTKYVEVVWKEGKRTIDVNLGESSDTVDKDEAVRLIQEVSQGLSYDELSGSASLQRYVGKMIIGAFGSRDAYNDYIENSGYEQRKIKNEWKLNGI